MLANEGAMHDDRHHHHEEPIDHASSDPNNLSGLEGVVVGHHHPGEDDFSDDEMGIMGGHATNLDGLDKDQIMKMID